MIFFIKIQLKIKYFTKKNMLPKVTGYTGFQSYGILPYPHLKPGKKTLDSNEVWQKS